MVQNSPKSTGKATEVTGGLLSHVIPVTLTAAERERASSAMASGSRRSCSVTEGGHRQWAPPFSSGSISTHDGDNQGGDKWPGLGPGFRWTLFSAPRCPFALSSGRKSVIILGSRKQSLPCSLIYEHRETSIIESVFNLTRIIVNDHWIQRETSKYT